MRGSKNKVGNPKNDEFYTPEWVFQKLNIKFDLDVCAPENGISWLPAENYYYEKIDGLAQDWYGKVWMNPPYSQPALWVDKFVTHDNGVCLLFLSKAEWAQKLWEHADAIVKLPTDFKFERIDGQRKDIFMPVYLMSMGDYCTAHLKTSGIGKVR
jgi:hypothetical protein